MSWKLRAAMSALLLAPQAVFALGLGDIRLGSALNEPLSAEIDLVAPTSDELGSLSAQLASRELFQRLGLDRPAYLDTVQFSVGRGRDGRNVLLVSSAAPISEPFVTFVVEVNWPRGRLLREYTVLLDPPVFAPKEAVPPAPVAAPRTARQAPAPAPAPVPAPVAAAAPAAGAATAKAAPAGETPSTYRVQRGDTLYGVASQFTGGGRSETNRMMIAMYRANPDAFGGNINVLRSGAILRVPGPDALQEVGAGEAASEIGRQTAAWRGEQPAEEPARLRLVTPAEPAASAAAPEPAATDPAARIEQLNREIEDSRRLLDLKSQELAQLQQQVAEEAAAQAAAAPPAAEPAPEAAAPVEPAPAEAPPQPAEAPAEAPPAEAAPQAAEPERSFVDSLTDNWQYVLGAAVLLLGGGLAYGFVRRRREEEFDDSIRSFEPPASAPVPSETQRLRTLAGTGMVVGTTTEEQELEDFRTATLPPSGRSAREYGVSFDDTLSTEEPADLDKGDPLAEADFHMAYGLYDQAADIVRLGLEKEPGRRDFEMKLLEIFFVSGDKAQFLEAARKFAGHRSEGETADWDRVQIMGRQLAPDDPLFEGATAGGGVDLNLEGGDSRVDLELLTPPGGEEGIDLDLGEALDSSDAEAETGEAEILDFDLEEGADRGTSPTAEMPRVGDQTAEMPAVDGTRLQPVSPDATAELAMDDLGIDLGELDALSGGAPEDDVTRLMPADEATRRMPAGEGGMDFDLGELSPEVSAAGTEEVTQVVDVGRALTEDTSEFTATEQISLDELPQMPELEPVTMSEVGTKLDLARAYVDMGDPDGARSILEEVLKEGSASQKQEAQRLLDSLPGA